MYSRALFLLLAAGSLTSSTAHAISTCTIERRTNLIHDGIESQGSVPNYSQEDFGGPNDCGPNTMAMIFGYWDANDWSCIIDGPSTYWSVPGDGISTLQARLRSELPYGSSLGTWDYNNVIPFISGDIGEDALDAADHNEPIVASWSTEDRDWVTWDNIRSHVRAEQPMAFLVTVPDLFAEWRWEGSGESGSEGIIYTHWMPIVGYQDHIRGRHWVDWSLDVYCEDYGRTDVFYLVTRSSWRAGGDSTLWYNWSGM